jgi:predicted MFS family arabinose efflux permease
LGAAPGASAGAAAAPPGPSPRAAAWALLAGNFAIGSGVMVAPGSLNDLARSLAVPVGTAGQLITAGALTMALGAPLLAALLGGWDRRRLLVFALVWYAIGHALSALLPHFAALLPVRAACMIGAAVFTPQAAAAIGVLAGAAQRGRLIAFVFMGWSLASVFGMPAAGFIAETAGWRRAFGAAAVLAALAAAWVWAALPGGIRPPPLSLASWGKVFANPLLMGMVAVTALSGAGQFTLFSYLTPFYRQVLAAEPAAVSALLFWFGALGLAGNLLLTRFIDRSSAGVCATLALALMALALLAWPLATGVFTMAAVLVPWGLGIFAANSAQQARLVGAAVALAPALLALNTSAIYAGQALGAAGGGALLAAWGWASLSWVGLGWMLLALALSAWLVKRAPGPVHV